MPVNMRLAAPAQNAGELSALRDAGAGEVYCGLLEPSWRERYGSHDSMNRRQGLANLQSRDALAALVRRAGQLSLPVFLTLNARYTPPQYPLVLDTARHFEAAGGTGLHVSDPGLATALREAGVGLRLSVSLLAVCTNRHTARLWASLGAGRIVFPRSLSPREMGLILAAVPGMEGEAMVMGDLCPLIDGLCRCYHGVGYRADPSGGGARRTVPTFDTTFTALACDTWGLRPGGMPCAACRMPELAGGGVGVGKLGGRGTPLAHRLSMLRFLQECRRQPDTDGYPALYRSCFGTECHCYYREAEP